MTRSRGQLGDEPSFPSVDPVYPDLRVTSLESHGESQDNVSTMYMVPRLLQEAKSKSFLRYRLSAKASKQR
jgi:hypothetical protein